MNLSEAAVSLLLVALLASGSILDRTEVRRTGTARLAAKEMLLLADAARWFHVDHGRWPSLDELRDQGYLPRGWDGRDPFGTPYRLLGDARGLTVAADPPPDLREAVAAALPGATVSPAGTVLRTVPAPGSGGLPEGRFLARYGRDEERTMHDDLFLGGHRIRDSAPPLEPDHALTLEAARDAYLPRTGGTMRGPLDVEGHLVSHLFRDREDPGYRLDPAGTTVLRDVVVSNPRGSLMVALRNGRSVLDILSRTGRPADWTCVPVMHNHGYPGWPQTWYRNPGNGYRSWVSLGPVDHAALATVANGAGGWAVSNYWTGSRRYAIESSVQMPFAFGGQLVCW
jgi:hypothetical protein